MRPVVILNPAARGGRNRLLRPVLETAFREVGLDVEVLETRGAGDAERLARAHADADLVIAAGGDGTVHEAVNGLAGAAATFGVLPLGTGNDFALALGMPGPVGEAVRALVEAPTVPIDLGAVRWDEVRDGERVTRERAFANCLGAGFDAHVAFLATDTKWLGGRAAYLAAVLRTLWAWRRPGVQVRESMAAETAPASGVGGGPPEADPVAFEGPIFLCEVGNGHSVGGGFLLTPDARPDDGLLDVCLVRHVAPRRALRLLPRTFTGAHVGAPEVRMDRARRISVDVEAGLLALQADGELLSFVARRIEVEVVPGALRVRAPRLGISAV